MEIKTNTALKNKFPKWVFVEIQLAKILEGEGELKTRMESVERDINRIFAKFIRKTGRKIIAVEVKKIGTKYQLLIEVR